MVDLNRALSSAARTGKVLFGVKSALNGAKTGKVRLIITSSNCSEKNLRVLQYSCKISEIPLVNYPKSSLELGRICGKPFPVSTLAIRDPGDSDILNIMEGENV